MHITEATENYMEAILMLGQQGSPVRSVDVARYLGFSKPTISQYMKQFVRDGLIHMGSDGHISLTDAGRQVAESTLERHRILAKLFIALGVDEKTALQDACKVEHDLSQETFDCIRRYYLEHIR